MRRYHWPGNVRELRNVVLGTLALGSAPPWEEAGGQDDGDPIARVLGLSNTWGAVSAVFLVIDNSAPPDECLYRGGFETGPDG